MKIKGMKVDTKRAEQWRLIGQDNQRERKAGNPNYSKLK